MLVNGCVYVCDISLFVCVLIMIDGSVRFLWGYSMDEEGCINYFCVTGIKQNNSGKDSGKSFGDTTQSRVDDILISCCASW